MKKVTYLHQESFTITSKDNENYDGGDFIGENNSFSARNPRIDSRQRFFSEGQAYHPVFGVENDNYMNPTPEQECPQTATNDFYVPSEMSASYHPQGFFRV